MKHLVGSKTHRHGLVVDGGYTMGKLRCNFSNKIYYYYYKKKRHMIKNCCKLQNEDKLTITNQKEKQPDTSGEANIMVNSHDDGEF